MKEERSPYMQERLEMYRAGLLDDAIALAQCVSINTIVSWRRRRGLGTNTDNVNVTRCKNCEKYNTLGCDLPNALPSDFCSRARRRGQTF